MPITRGQMERQLRMGGGIMQVAPRQGALLGGLKKAVKGVAKGIGSFLKSDLGKAALLGVGAFGLPKIGTFFQGMPGLLTGNVPQLGLGELLTKKAADVTLGDTLKVGAMGTVLGGVLAALDPQEEEEIVQKRNLGALKSKLTKAYQDLNYDPAEIPALVANDMSEYTAGAGGYAEGGRIGFGGGSDMGTVADSKGNVGPGKGGYQGGGTGPVERPGGGGNGGPSGPPTITGVPSPEPKTIRDRLKERGIETLNFAKKYNPLGLLFGTPVGAAEMTREELLKMGAMEPGMIYGYNLTDPGEALEKFRKSAVGFKEAEANPRNDPQSALNFMLDRPGLYGDVIENKDFIQGAIDEGFLADPSDYTKQKPLDQYLAAGGRAGYARGDTAEQNAIQASGIMDLPLNQNPAGITELDLRESGGFIPPVGVKEKADDIPAMLSNNEFVFTADAVRGMGDGNVNLGAQRMYDMMKKLENGGRV